MPVCLIKVRRSAFSCCLTGCGSARRCVRLPLESFPWLPWGQGSALACCHHAGDALGCGDHRDALDAAHRQGAELVAGDHENGWGDGGRCDDQTGPGNGGTRSPHVNLAVDSQGSRTYRHDACDRLEGFYVSGALAGDYRSNGLNQRVFEAAAGNITRWNRAGVKS